jgi:hypothetical protein
MAPGRILITQKFAGLGGSQVSLAHHLALLDRSRFEPVVAVSNTGWLTQELDKMNIRWSRLPFGHWTKPFSIPANVVLVAKLRNLIRRENISLVHANEHFVGPQSLLAAKWAGVPAICHFRTGLEDLSPARIRKYLYAKFDRVLPVAEVLRKRLAEHAFHCDYDIEALAKAGSLITAGQSAEVRSKAGLVGIVDAPA